MILLIAGTSHVGKTLISQKLMEKYHFPYFSLDHLKMGLLRNNYLTYDLSDSELTVHLWPIVREIIKTAIENNQNLIIEGCYIPFNYQEDFSQEYLSSINYYCLIMTSKYLFEHQEEITKYENIIEKRLIKKDYLIEELIKEHEFNYQNCLKFNLPYILIDHEFNVEEIISLIKVKK